MTRTLLGLFVATVVLLGPARAQPHGVADEPSPGIGSSGWVVVEESDGTWRLLHLPPRGIGEGAATAGQLRPVVTLETSPVAMAAHRGRVYLVYQDSSPQADEPNDPTDSLTDPDRSQSPSEAPPAPKPDPRVRIYSMRAVSVWAGNWSYEPQGRFESHRSLQTQARVVGAFVNGDGGLVLQLETEQADRESWLLGDDGWSAISSGEIAPSDPFSGIGLGLAGEREGAELQSLHAFGDRRVWTQLVGSGLEIWSSTSAGEYRVGVIEDLSQPFWAVPVRVGGGRLMVLERIDEPDSADGFRVTEISLASGEVLYQGPPVQFSPVSAGELRVLAVTLSLFMLVILMLTFRPRMDPSAIVIPKGTALAEPGRRFLASMIDFVTAAFIVSQISGISFSSLLTGAVILETGGGWIALPGMMLTGAGLGAIGEWSLALTPGKLITGCRVIRLGEQPQRLSFSQAVLRNTVKWIAPPIAAMAMLDPQTRHRGDDLARSVVIIQAQPLESEGEPKIDPETNPETDADAEPSDEQ